MCGLLGRKEGDGGSVFFRLAYIGGVLLVKWRQGHKSIVHSNPLTHHASQRALCERLGDA